MGSLRTTCVGCGKKIRVPKSGEWEKEPVQDIKTQQVIFHGLHKPKYETCRACFKSNTGKRRPTPSQNKAKRERVTRVIQSQPAPAAPQKKGKR